MAVTRPGLQEDAHARRCFLMLIPDITFFSHNYFILAMREQSKILVLSSASIFNCSCCFDFSSALSAGFT